MPFYVCIVNNTCFLFEQTRIEADEGKKNASIFRSDELSCSIWQEKQKKKGCVHLIISLLIKFHNISQAPGLSYLALTFSDCYQNLSILRFARSCVFVLDWNTFISLFRWMFGR